MSGIAISYSQVPVVPPEILKPGDEAAETYAPPAWQHEAYWTAVPAGAGGEIDAQGVVVVSAPAPPPRSGWHLISRFTEDRVGAPSRRRGKQASILEDLDSIAEHASKPGWDGEGGDSVAPATIQIARCMSSYLADLFQDRPDVSASPDGSVDFDWTFENDSMLTVGITSEHDIVFAATFGDSGTRGREPWKGSLPPMLEYSLACIKERLL